MMRFLSLILTFIAPSLWAQDFTSDAFGLYGDDPVRDTWAGYVETPTGAQIRPAAQAHDILFFLGPKSVVAGGEPAHGVALTLDRHGNLSQDGETVGFQLDIGRQRAGKTIGGIADVLFVPPPIARFIQAGAYTDTRQSARADYRIVPDLQSVTPVLTAQASPVTAREVFKDIETDILADRFGNALIDGVALPVMITHADGRSSQTVAITQDARASARILTRDMAETGRFHVEIGQVRSGDMPLVLETVTGPPQVGIAARYLADIDAVELRIGPFLTSSGYLLHDGTPVVLNVTPASGAPQQMQGWVKDGYFETTLALAPGFLPAALELNSITGTSRARLELGARDE